MKRRENLPEVLYTPESEIRRPSLLVHSMWNDLMASRELSWRLFVRDISAKYRQSILGVFWSFLPPIIAGLIFIVLQSKNILHLEETDIPYPVFVLTGTVLWQLFSESLNAPLKSVLKARTILTRINFPREALIVSAFYEILFNLMIKVVILIGIFLFFHVKATWGLLLAPLAILMLVLLGITIGMFLAPLGVLYSDISSGLSVFTILWFFVTPVVYPKPESLPLSLMTTLNPVSPLLIAARDLITKGILLNIESFVIVSVLTIISLFLVWVMYKLSFPIIIERMSA